MKKIILLSIVATVLMTSCGSGETKKEAVATDSVATEVVEVKESKVLKLSDASQLKATDKPVVVDFNAKWCMPCQEFAPHFESVASKMSDKATFISVDIDNWKELAMEFEANSIPMVVIIKPNGEKESTVGYMTEEEFEKFLNEKL